MGARFGLVKQSFLGLPGQYGRCVTRANGGALPCVRLACATSGDCVTKEPHLSPQHYELNAKQHVLDRTRVSVSRRYSKGNKANKLGGSRCADLTAPHRSVPSLLTDNEAQSRLQREGKNQIVNHTNTLSES